MKKKAYWMNAYNVDSNSGCLRGVSCQKYKIDWCAIFRALEE